MVPRPTITGRDQNLPPFLTPEEWRQIVAMHLLSPRQAEVASLVMHSLTDKEIAATLGISKRTVRVHFEACKHRLSAGDRVGIACRVFEAFRNIIGR